MKIVPKYFGKDIYEIVGTDLAHLTQLGPRTEFCMCTLKSCIRDALKHYTNASLADELSFNYIAQAPKDRGQSYLRIRAFLIVRYVFFFA